MIELDGLKEAPIQHCEFNPRDWTQTAKQVIKKRIESKSHSAAFDIRFNLLAVKRRAGSLEELRIRYQQLIGRLAALTSQLNKLLAGKRQVRQSALTADIQKVFIDIIQNFKFH